MKAIRLKEAGKADQFETIEIAKPEINDGEVLIKVEAVSINPVDMKTRSGKAMYARLKAEENIIIGWDVAGTVVESRADGFAVGARVFGMINFPGHGKAYAEYVAAPAAHIAHIPTAISFEDAAATTLAALTAWQALTKQAEVKAGERVVIQGAAGGVGHFAVQIAKHLGAEVIAVASASKKEYVESLHPNIFIDYTSQDITNAIHNADFVLDTIGGDNIDKSIAITREGGTVISIPSGISEHITEKAKTKGVNGFFFMVESNGEDMKQLADLLEKGILKPKVSATYSFTDIQKAHEQIETGKTLGKIILKW